MMPNGVEKMPIPTERNNFKFLLVLVLLGTLTALLFSLPFVSGCGGNNSSTGSGSASDDGSTVEEKSPPSIQVPQATKKDGKVTVVIKAGEVESGKPRDFKVEVKNRGEKPLELKLKKKPCACLYVVDAPNVDPDSKQFVTLRWAPTSNQFEELKVESIFETNDPEYPLLEVRILGTHNPSILFSPTGADVDFGDFSKLKTYLLNIYSFKWTAFELTAEVKGKAGENAAFDLKILKLNPNDTVDQKRIKSGYTLQITPTKDIPLGFVRRELLLNVVSDKGEKRTFTLPVVADKAHELFTLAPDKYVKFTQPSILKGAEASFTLKFQRPLEPDAVKVMRVEPSFLQTEVTRIGDGKDWRVKINIPANHSEVRIAEAEGELFGRVLLRVPGSSAEVALELEWLSDEKKKKK